MAPAKRQKSARSATIFKQEPDVEPSQCPSSVFDLTTVKQEPVEADEPLASPKREVEYAFVKVETPYLQELEAPDGHDSTQDPLSNDEEECSPSEDLLLSSALNIVKVEYEEDEEATHEDDREEYSASEDFLGPSTSYVEKMEDEDEEEAIVSESEGQELKHVLESTSSGSESESAFPVGVEDESGNDDSGGLVTNAYLAAGMINWKQTSTTLNSSSGKFLHSCNVCNKTFSTKSSMKRHLRLHSGERPFTCDVCNKAFTESGHLNRHVLLHTGERPYCCGVCNKTFKDNWALKRHFLMHSGERPYCCGICNKTFTQSTSLKQHSYLHTDVRPYSCQECHKRFTCSGHLKIHMRTHTGERPYSCNICQKKFSRNIDLRNHLVLHTRK